MDGDLIEFSDVTRLQSSTDSHSIQGSLVLHCHSAEREFCRQLQMGVSKATSAAR